MRIAGASTTSAPSARSRAASALACARARVTTTLRPLSGRRSNQASSSRSAATGPTIVTAGARMPARRPRRGARAWCAASRWPGSVPSCTIAAGSSRGAPVGDELLGDPRQLRGRPCRRRASRETRPARPSRSPVSGFAGSSWPVTNATALAAPRNVTGMPAYAGAAMPAVTPGTTSKSIPSAAQHARLLAAAAEDERVAALQPHDGLARRARARRAAARSPPAGPAARRRPCRRRSARRRRGAAASASRGMSLSCSTTSALPDHLERPRGEQPGIARPGPDEVRPVTAGPSRPRRAAAARARSERLRVGAGELVGEPREPSAGADERASSVDAPSRRVHADRRCGSRRRARRRPRARPRARLGGGVAQGGDRFAGGVVVLARPR